MGTGRSAEAGRISEDILELSAIMICHRIGTKLCFFMEKLLLLDNNDCAG